MAKLSEQKKVELLENAVLNGTTEETARIMEEYAPFEFTARALGYAARFRGAEMVKCLIDHGATFAYEAVPAFVKKYATKVAISNIYSYNVDYSLYLLKDQKIDPVPDGAQILDDEERAKVLELLHTEAEKAAVNEADILYFSILYGDSAIREACAKLEICKLSDSRAANIRCDINYAHMDGLNRHFRDGFTWTLRRANAENFKRILMDILPMLGEKQMQLMPADLFYSIQDKKQFFTAYCAEGVFDLAIKHTNLTEKVKKWDMLYALVDHNNASGVQYALAQEWISKPKDLETLLKYAQSKESTKAELVGSLLDRLEKNAPAKKKEDPLALSANPLSATELKKIWATKKLEDGTLMITGYKGEALDVIIPDKIGKTSVTAISSDTFNPTAPRVTREQAEIRQNLYSVEIPGSFGVVPKNLFGCIYGYPHFRLPNLKRVVLGEGIREIQWGAFMGCTGLEEVVLPQSVTTLEYGVFYNCTALTKVELPQSVTTIGPCAFFNCKNLKEVTLPASAVLESNSFSDCPGLQDKAGMVILGNILYNYYGNAKSVVVPEGITVIGSKAFCGNTTMEEVTLPESLKELGGWAFYGCTALTKVELPEGLEEIASQVFCDCHALTEIHIPATVRTIGNRFNDVFQNCEHLTIYAPSGSYAEDYAKKNNIPFVAE